MTDRTLRTVVAGLTGLLVVVIAVTLLIVVGRDGSPGASPSAPPIALGSPSEPPAATPTESTSPSEIPEPSATPVSEASPGATASGSPGATTLATLTYVGLKLDATADPGGEARIVTFRSDGAGTVTAKLSSTSPQGTTHMCLLVGTKEVLQGLGLRHVHRQDQPGACELDGHARGQRARN